jgi:hypothetical protein
MLEQLERQNSVSLREIVSLPRFLGNTFGPIVYDSVLKPLLDPPGAQYKPCMEYHVTLSDSRRAPSGFDPRLLDGRYFHVESKLAFHRVQTRPMTVIVSIVTDAGALTRSVQQRDVVYREVVQLLPEDQALLSDLYDAVDSEPVVTEKQNLLRSVVRLSVEINGNPAKLLDIRRQALGLDFVYNAGLVDSKIEYKFDFRSFLPKVQTVFPIVIAEPVRKLDVEFDYFKASIANIDCETFFSLGTDPKVDKGGSTRKINVHNSGEEGWLYNGGSIFIHWTL